MSIISITGSDTETVQLIVDSNTFTQNSQNSQPTDIDGNTYETVVIGAQEWFKENLRTTKYSDGSPILYGADTSIWNNDTIGAYAWYDNDSSSYASTYGVYIIGMQLITLLVYVQQDGMCQVIQHGQYLIAFWRIMDITMMEVQREINMRKPWQIVSGGVLHQI